ncbi:MAG: lamin tail domain-containing protein [Bacteroidia bacterium]|nr:lamin tail domain-containing protein [Bacteroidia bacterium]
MKHIILPMILLLAGVSLRAQCVYISEYLEGSGNNKCIEIYNGSGAALDLAAGGYALEIYANGNAAPTATISLSGTVAPGDVYVLCHTGAVVALLSQADQTSGSLSMNGDDAIALKNSGGTLDVVGQKGFDPGLEWTGTGCVQGTADGTLIRKSALICPSFDGLSAFNPSTEWDCYAMDSFSDIGSHFLASCVLYDLSVTGESCNNGVATGLLDFIAFNPGSTGFSLVVSPDPGGLSGSYLYSDLPLSLTGFTGDNLTPYSFAIADLSTPGCITDTLSGVVFDCPVADELLITQMPPGCAEVNSPLVFEVCAVESSTGKTQPDYAGTISLIPDAGYSGMVSGSLSQMAVNGCATFSVSYDTPEDISFTVDNGFFPSLNTGIIPVRMICPLIVLTTAVINPCGNDSQNEYFGARTGPLAFSVDELVISSIDPAIGNQPNTNFVWSASGTEKGGNPSESCGAIGLQCNRILDINHPLDSPIIHNLLAQLNAQAGCTPALFVAPTGPNLGTLPPHSDVVFFLGAGGNASLPLAPGFDGLGTNLDFSGFCGQGPVYVLFGYHKNPTAAFGFFSNTAGRIYQIGAGGNITSEIVYTNPIGTSEAEIIDSAGVYTAAADCTPLDLFQDILLAAEWLWLEGYSHDPHTVVLNWEVNLSGSSGKFFIEKHDGISAFVPVGEMEITGGKQEPAIYTYTDHGVSGAEKYYRIQFADVNGEISYSRIVEVSPYTAATLSILRAWPNPAEKDFQMEVLNPEEEQEIEIHFSTIAGNSIFFCKFELVKGVNTITFDISEMTRGLYLYRVHAGGNVVTGRLSIQ